MVAKSEKSTHAKRAVPKKEAGHAAGKPTTRYFEGVGRRKVAVARVRLREGSGKAMVLGKRERSMEEYFPAMSVRETALAPLSRLNLLKKFDLTIRVRGSGPSSQAEAVRLGIARALVKFDESLKKNLRVLGYLTRDARMVERKKYGLKKARRAPQWSKR